MSASSLSSSDRATATHRPPPGAVGKQRPQKGLRASWSAAAMAPQLRGSRATAWLGVWDSACTGRRVCMLESLRALHAASNSNDLEGDLGDAAPLLLTRITSWWKLRYRVWASDTVSSATAGSAKAVAAERAATCATSTTSPKRQTASAVLLPEAVPDTDTNRAAGVLSPTGAPCPSYSATSSSELLAQVEAITLFLRGSRFLLQFVEGGGVATLTDCLETTSSSTSLCARAGAVSLAPALFVQERRAITLLLLHIANSGRVYRELVGDEEGLLHVLHTLQREADASVAAPLTELLAVLGQGHPRHTKKIEIGLLRVLEKAMQVVQESTPTPSSSPGSWRASRVVVLHTARAIRALQLQKEQHHYARFDHHSGNGGDVLETNVDYVPIVGMDSAVNAYSPAGADVEGLPNNSSACDPLLRPISRGEYLDILFQLVLDDQHAAHQAEGNELLSMAAKNLHLTQEILTRCLDTVDDDDYVIHGCEEHTAMEQHRQLRQRRQLSCGRTAVLLLISRPMTKQRKQLLLQLVSQRSGQLSLLKNLRLAAYSDVATLVACCQALQFIVRGAAEMQCHHMGARDVSPLEVTNGSGDSSTSTSAMWLRVTQSVQAALGESVFQMLLFQNLSEGDCITISRAARDVVAPLSLAEAS
ncbi:hypothetical protein JKF63_04551 [Porcisia hertigi]|uniref:Uncharacterized protein n=1 Tax=Porcisia hertigi TaxID=2761500 RepID=A0A836ITJ4_9TRYP|nr:hypothetical protein JKF63_04551 [Porcisia hertigi]